MADETRNQAVEIVSATAVESIERAMIDMQIATAKRYPRPQLSKIRESIMDVATLDEETAESCFYTLPRGGRAIQGESIRLLEIAITQYQNARVLTRVIDTVTTGDAPHVLVQGVAFDLEKNVAYSLEKRRRITKKKFKDAIDEDDINLAVNACSAIAYRDAGLKMVGRAFLKPIFEKVKLVAIGDIKSLVAKRTEVVEKLNKMGAPTDRILAVIDARTVDDITVEKLQQLIGLGTALKDGEVTLEDAFPIIKPPEKLGVDGLKEKIDKNAEANNAANKLIQDNKPPAEPAKRGRPAKEQPPAEAPKTENPLRPQWYCNACNNVLVEPIYDAKGVIQCPLCKQTGEVNKATEQNYKDAGYTETK